MKNWFVLYFIFLEPVGRYFAFTLGIGLGTIAAPKTIIQLSKPTGIWKYLVGTLKVVKA